MTCTNSPSHCAHFQISPGEIIQNRLRQWEKSLGKDPMCKGVQPGKAAELRMHARARPRRTRNACAAGVQKWRFAGVETAPPCPPESLRAWLPVPWSLSTLPASVRRSQRLLRSLWRLGDRNFCQPTSALSRPTRACPTDWLLSGMPLRLCDLSQPLESNESCLRRRGC